MSLFPAYTSAPIGSIGVSQNESTTNQQPTSEWLTNSSFPPDKTCGDLVESEQHSIGEKDANKLEGKQDDSGKLEGSQISAERVASWPPDKGASEESLEEVSRSGSPEQHRHKLNKRKSCRTDDQRELSTRKRHRQRSSSSESSTRRHKHKKRKERESSGRYDKKDKKRKKERRRAKESKRHSEKAAKESRTKQGYHSEPAHSLDANQAPLRGVFLEDSCLKPEAAVCVDRKADMANRSAPTMYFRYVAAYKRLGKRALGRPPPRKSLATERYFSRGFRKRLRRAPAASGVSSIPVAAETFDESAGYVALSEPVAAGETVVDVEDRLANLETDIAFEFRRETVAFQRKLAERPQDEQLWLQLVEFQDRRLLHRVTSQQLLERKMSILERALRACPGSVPLRLCRLSLLEADMTEEEAKKEWTSLLFSHPADLELWRRYLAYQQHSPRFTLSSLFSAYGKCLEKMRQFQSDQARPHRPPAGLHPFMLEVLAQLCKVLRQAGYLERAIAIYQALLELNLHSPLQDGTDVVATMEPFWDARLPRIGEKGARGWPTELAERRRAWAEDKDNATEDVEEQEDWEEKLLEEAASQPREKLWQQLEYGREERHWLPWDRPGAEDECEDTDRIVHYDTIRRFLFRLPESLHARAVEDFVTFLTGDDLSRDDDVISLTSPAGSSLSAALAAASKSSSSEMDGENALFLLGMDGSGLTDTLALPPLGPKVDSPAYADFTFRVIEQSLAAVKSSHEQEKIKRCLARFLTYRASSASSVNLKVLSDPSCCESKHAASDVPELEASSACRADIGGASRAGSVSGSKGGAAVDAAKTRAVLKECRRQFKALLRSERQNVPLFVEYAAFEQSSSGSTETAAKVLETALQQATLDDPVRFIVVHRYCQLRIPACSGPADAAIGSCLRTISGLFEEFTPSAPPPAPAQLARAVARLRRALRDALSLGTAPASLVPVAACLTWALLLTSGLPEAAEVTTAVTSELESRMRTRALDSVLTGLSRITADILRAARPLSDPLSWWRHLQVALQSAVRHAPRDVRVAALAVQHHRPNWWQNLRASATEKDSSLLISVLRTAEDLRLLSSATADNPAGAGGTVAMETTANSAQTAAARLRRKVARLVSEPALQHCLPLWLVYLQLQLLTNAKDFESVCYRAVQACPWSKHVYLYLSTRQLARACDLMSRAGLRLRVPLEELDVLLEEEPELAAERAEAEAERAREIERGLERVREQVERRTGGDSGSSSGDSSGESSDDSERGSSESGDDEG